MLNYDRPAAAAPTYSSRNGSQGLPATQRYRYEGTIASTCRHMIHSAYDTTTGRNVVLKQAIVGRPDAGREAHLQLICEGAMLRFLARRHIAAPRYFDLYDMDGQPCLVMTKIAGRTLEAMHSAGQLSPEDTVRLIARLCASLAELHRVGYVHHDIKPANIVVQPDSTPVLIDWGSAEAIRAPSDRRRNSWFTPAFVSPAQASGLARLTNDLFALGMTIDALVQWPSPRLAAIIAKAIAQAEPRYRTAAELGRDLAQLALLDRAAGYFGLQAI